MNVVKVKVRSRLSAEGKVFYPATRLPTLVSVFPSNDKRELAIG